MADLAENARRKYRAKSLRYLALGAGAIRRIDALFEIERGINGEMLERRRAARQELSAPLVADLQTWMRERRAKLSRQGDGLHAQAMERVHALPRRRPHLPVEQRRRTSLARHRSGAEVVTLLRL